MFDYLGPELNPYRYVSNIERIDSVMEKSLESVGNSPPRTSGITIVVLNKNAPTLLSQIIIGYRAIRKILHDKSIECELIIGDTGSTSRQTLQIYKEIEGNKEKIRLVVDLDYHFSKNNNELSRIAEYEVLLFLNNDCLIAQNPELIIANYLYLESSKQISAVCPLLIFPDKRVQHAGIFLSKNSDYYALPHHIDYKQNSADQNWKVRKVEAVTGACLFVRNEIFRAVGGFDEKFEEESQDVALCLEMTRFFPRHDIVVTNFGDLVHLENGTREKGSSSASDRARFIRLYSSFLASQEIE